MTEIVSGTSRRVAPADSAVPTAEVYISGARPLSSFWSRGLPKSPCCYGPWVNHWEVPTIVDIPVIRSARGAVGVVEKEIPFPFDLKRVYYLFDVPSNAVRGSHAHKSLNQLIIAISGSFRVDLQDRTTRTSVPAQQPGHRTDRAPRLLAHSQ